MHRLDCLRLPISIALGLFVGQNSWAWQAPNDPLDTPRLTIDAETVDLVPAEEIVDVETGGDGAATEPSVGEADSSDAAAPDEASPRTVSPPRQPAPPLQPEAAEGTEAEPAAGDATEPATPEVDTTELKATIFKGIEPGHTPLAQLTEPWGEAKETKIAPNGTVMTFELAPFPRIDATINRERVTAIVIYLAHATPSATVVEQLGLAGIVTVDVLDRAGRKIGDHYPERGVTLVLDKDPTNVARILLEPLRAESFLLRVKRDRDHRWQRNLNDLNIAIRLDETDHRAWWLKAEALAEAGDDAAAMLAVERAIHLDASVPTYQLTAARLQAKLGKFETAIETTRRVLDDKTISPMLKARAALQLGDLLAESPEHKFNEAIKQHQQAIELALPLATDRSMEMRRAAKHTLIDAHMAIADDIARGTWRNQETIVPQWLERGRAIADEMIASGDGDPTVLLDIGCCTLSSATWLDGKIDPTPAVRQVQADARKFCASCDDTLYTHCISWKLGKALVDAVDIERARGNAEKAIAYGAAAQEELERLVAAEHRFDESQFQLARLYFLLGSIEAVQRQDHAAAIKWFDKAMVRLARPEPDADLTVTARRGEWLVSMGISYWQAGDQKQGLKLTEIGSDLIESAQREGAIGEEALAVPYHNLAFMYKETGDADKALEFSQLAAQINAATTLR